MRAIVFAGGVGTRLGPHTPVLPKPLLPVGERPVLDVIIRQLRRYGFSSVTIATGHLGALIEAFFRDGASYGIAIDYHHEQQPLGTAGALGCLDGLDAPLLVMNGNLLTDLDYQALWRDHQQSGALITIATTSRDVQVSLGVLEFADSEDPDVLTDYHEKPHYMFDASMGVFVVSPRALTFIEPGERLDFPELVSRLLDAGEHVHAHRATCYWRNLSRHDDYEQALEEFEAMLPRLLPPVDPSGTGPLTFRLSTGEGDAQSPDPDTAPG